MKQKIMHHHLLPDAARSAELVIPRRFRDEAFERLVQPGAPYQRRLRGRLHTAACDRAVRLLSGESLSTPETPAPEHSSSPTLTYALAASEEGVRNHYRTWEREAETNFDALLIEPVSTFGGGVFGWTFHPSASTFPRSLSGISFPGMGMFRSSLGNSHARGALTSVTAETSGARSNGRLGAPASERWSRTIGALSQSAWERLRSLRVGLVGCGRLGSLVGVGLVRTGTQDLTLVDPDIVEVHNLGESARWTMRDVGAPKVERLARIIEQESRTRQGITITPIARSVTQQTALEALRGRDVLICCADRPSARLAAGLLGALYLIPVIDAGTGIFGDSDDQMIGSDVRLILPGESCIECLGGTTDPEEARMQLRHADAEVELGVQDWRNQRAGSLRSWNEIAAGFVRRVLEMLTRGRLDDTRWWRLEWDEGALEVQRWPAVGRGDGRCICHLTGRGDDGLGRVPQWLRSY